MPHPTMPTARNPVNDFVGEVIEAADLVSGEFLEHVVSIDLHARPAPQRPHGIQHRPRLRRTSTERQERQEPPKESGNSSDEEEKS